MSAKDADRSIFADGISRYFGELRAVDDVSLNIGSGRIFGFLGPNGSGKTTTVKVLTTILALTAGSAWVAGFDVKKDQDQVRAHIGVALQEIGLDPLMTAREMLGLQSRLFSARRGGGAGGRRPSAAHGGPRRRRSQEEGGPVLGRHEAAPRPGPRPRQRPRRSLSRRADHGARPGQPPEHLGRGAPPQLRRRHDHLPHHPVPRRGRQAGRRGGGDQQRQDRGPGRAGRR